MDTHDFPTVFHHRTELYTKIARTRPGATRGMTRHHDAQDLVVPVARDDVEEVGPARVRGVNWRYTGTGDVSQ